MGNVFYMLDEDNRKLQFVGVRMERNLFRALKERADRDGTDLSTTIRGLCSEKLNL